MIRAIVEKAVTCYRQRDSLREIELCICIKVSIDNIDRFFYISRRDTDGNELLSEDCDCGVEDVCIKSGDEIFFDKFKFQSIISVWNGRRILQYGKSFSV